MAENDESEYGFDYNPDIQKEFKDVNNSSKYGFIPEVKRLYLKSHIFGGSHVRTPREVYVLNSETLKLEKRTITTPKLQERIFLEILSNALDVAFESQRTGIHFPKVIITMSADTISLRNGGIPVPVDIHEYFYSQNDPKNQFGTCAELIFGVIGAGSNTSESVAKQGGGQNGYGAKLTNVFSRRFEVEIGDNIRGFQQKVTWRKNMMEKDSVQINPEYTVSPYADTQGLYHIIPNGPAYTGENYVQVTWKQDFRKFGIDQFTKDELELYMKYALEASYVGKFVVEFNGKILDARSSSSYLNFYPKDISKNSIIHYEFSGAQQLGGKALEDAIANQQIIPVVELIILDSPNEGMHISYCNGIYNIDGGEHTDTAYRETLKSIKELIKSGKGFDKNLDDSKVDIRVIKKHATIIINFKCADPTFKGQDKEKLLKPSPKITITVEEMGKFKKWAMVDAIYKAITGKNLKDINGKGDKGKGRIKGNINFKDANWFGTKRQNETVLILCEGNSAGSYVRKWILAKPEKADKYAVLFLRGKFKNVTDLGLMELLSDNGGKNKEIREIIQYMGFQFDVDYTIAQNAASLRYGNIYGMVDADPDGNHIQSLIFNFIYRFFPSFLAAGRFLYVPTPVLRVLTSRGTTKEIFYNMYDYEEYVKKIQGVKHEVKYFKGLASGKDSFAIEDAQKGPLALANFDQMAHQALDVAFKKGLTNDRKKWINFWRDKINTPIMYEFENGDPLMKFVNISQYINTKLVEYSIYSFSRALPSYKDGLKKSQRQVLWYMLKEWDFGKSKKKEANIGDIASAAKTATNYHHGDLTGTLARLGSNYPGSNNIPLLAQEGQFGTREHLGSDLGASRYVATKPEDVIKHIFSEELMNLVDVNVVENKKVEPKWLPCKIPLHIVNGVLGIATAYSLNIPSYHPIDVIIWIMKYISSAKCFPLIPWFRGFTGIVELEIFKGRHSKDESMLMQNQDTISYYEGLTLKTTGLFNVIKEYDHTFTEEINGKKEKVKHRVSDIFITEIPIGVATVKYVEEMEKKCDWVEDKATTTDTPNLIIHAWKDPVSVKNLKLSDRMGMCNITLIDDDSFPVQMRNVYQALVYYCDNMIQLYIKLKETRLTDFKIKIDMETKIIKLLDLLLSETVLTKKRDEASIEKDLAVYDIEFAVYDKLKRRSETKEGYQKHVDNLAKLQEEYRLIAEKHHLAEWYEDLEKITAFLQKDKTYIKFKHHEYPFVDTPIEDLLSGKVKSPFTIKEEAAPAAI